MKDKSEKAKAKPVWLARSEAAQYVGVSGESAIRAAEGRGLDSVTDNSGQVWLSTDSLEAFKWRSKLPSAAKRAAIVRHAERAREREARERERLEAAEDERRQAQWETTQGQFAAEDTLCASVRRKADTLRQAFEREHMDERTAGLALGFDGHEARYQVRDLVRRGLLRRVESPLEPTVETSFDGLREIESRRPLCSGGPFVPRKEVLGLREESAAAAVTHRQRPTAIVQAEAASSLIQTAVGQFLSALFNAARTAEKPRV